MDESMGNSQETQLPTPNKKYTNLKNMGLFNKYVWLWIHVYVLNLGRLKIMMVCALRTFFGKAGFVKIPVSVISQSSIIAFGSRSTRSPLYLPGYQNTSSNLMLLGRPSCVYLTNLKFYFTKLEWNENRSKLFLLRFSTHWRKNPKILVYPFRLKFAFLFI